VFEDHVVYNMGAEYYSVDYAFDDATGTATLVGTAKQVRQVYEEVSMEPQGEMTMATATKVNEVLGLKAEASEASLLSAVEDMKSNVTKLTAEKVALLASAKATEDRLVVVLRAFNLAPDASDTDVAKCATEFTSASEQLKKLEPEIKQFRDERDAFEKKVADGEVDFLIKRGKDYGVNVDEKSRPALTMYRKSNPVEFAASYKAALDGMQAGDRPELFTRVTAPGSQLAAPGPRATTGIDANADFEAAVTGELAAAAAQSIKLSRADAMSKVVRRLSNGSH
jgi:hypothetical protein